MILTNTLSLSATSAGKTESQSCPKGICQHILYPISEQTVNFDARPAISWPSECRRSSTYTLATPTFQKVSVLLFESIASHCLNPNMSLLREFLNFHCKTFHTYKWQSTIPSKRQWVGVLLKFGWQIFSLGSNLVPQTPEVWLSSMLLNSCLSSSVQPRLSGFLFGWRVNDLNAGSNHPPLPAESHSRCQVLKIKQKDTLPFKAVSFHSPVQDRCWQKQQFRILFATHNSSFNSEFWIKNTMFLQYSLTSFQLLSDIDCSIPFQWRLGVELKPV